MMPSATSKTLRRPYASRPAGHGQLRHAKERNVADDDDWRSLSLVTWNAAPISGSNAGNMMSMASAFSAESRHHHRDEFRRGAACVPGALRLHALKRKCITSPD